MEKKIRFLLTGYVTLSLFVGIMPAFGIASVDFSSIVIGFLAVLSLTVVSAIYAYYGFKKGGK